MTVTTTISDRPDATQRPTARRACVLLARYGAALLGSGATCSRLDMNIGRMARTWGLRECLTIMPRHLHLTVTDAAGEDLFTAIETVEGAGISFSLNTRLSRLSWQVHDNTLSIDEATRRFDAIMAEGPGGLAPLAQTFLTGVANASFCRLFGGDAVAMAVVAVATMAGICVKSALLRRRVDLRLAVLAAAFVSAVLAAGDALFGLGSTPDIALGASVLYLVPGVPLLNSFSDLVYRHYICAFSRLTDALVITACLSAGLCGAMLLMGRGMF